MLSPKGPEKPPCFTSGHYFPAATPWARRPRWAPCVMRAESVCVCEQFHPSLRKTGSHILRFFPTPDSQQVLNSWQVPHRSWGGNA